MKETICFVIPSFRRGGVERVTLNIINSLDFTKFNVFLIICVNMENEYISFLDSKVNVIELKKRNVRESLPQIFRIISKERPHIVFTSFNHVSLPVLMYRKIAFKKYKTIVRLNTLPSNKLTTKKRAFFYARLFNYFLRTADAIVSQTTEMSEDISSFYQIERKRITTIQNPVDIKNIKSLAMEDSEICFDPNYFNLVSIGSLSEVKGFDLLIDAIHSLKLKGNSKYRLYIIGDNRDPNEDYRSKLQKIIQDYELVDCVYLVGFKKNPFPILKKADAFVLSSRKEGFPNVVLEALVLGKPCLVTNCIDFSGIITVENGTVVEKDSASSLEEGLLEIPTIKGGEHQFTNFNFNNWFLKVIAK